MKRGRVSEDEREGEEEEKKETLAGEGREAVRQFARGIVAEAEAWRDTKVAALQRTVQILKNGKDECALCKCAAPLGSSVYPLEEGVWLCIKCAKDLKLVQTPRIGTLLFDYWETTHTSHFHCVVCAKKQNWKILTASDNYFFAVCYVCLQQIPLVFNGFQAKSE